MSGRSPHDPPSQGVLPDSEEDKIQPAMPGVVISIAQPQTTANVQQPARLGTLQQPAANERAGSLAGYFTTGAATAPLAFFPGMMPIDANAGKMMTEQQQALIQQQVSQILAQQQAHQAAQQQVQAQATDAITQHTLQNWQMMHFMQQNQLQQNQHQQLAAQRLAQQAAGTATLLHQVQYANATAAAAARSSGGEQPPAKRQALVDPKSIDPATIHTLAKRIFQQYEALGKVPPTDEGKKLFYQKCILAAYEKAGVSLAALQQQQLAARENMRVTIDKSNRYAADKLVNAVDTTSKNTADEVMRRCEEISRNLKQHIGKRSGGGGGESATTVTQEALLEACGDTARYLKQYQIVGINFLNLLYSAEVGGAILADEMGLGKTAQLICYMGAIKALHNDAGPHLIVVPASLLENWQRELRRWCPGLKSVVYYGKHRMAVRKRLMELRNKLQAGETVTDDLSDLHDDEMLARLAASHREEAAAAADAEEEDGFADDDPLGLNDINDRDDDDDSDYDDFKDREMERNGGNGHGGWNQNSGRRNGNGIANNISSRSNEPEPIKWDYSKTLPPAPFNVMLTSYTLFERDSSEQRADRAFLESWKWSHLIMDEAHALKNKDARRSTRLRRVANVSRRRIMMTGTPLQNDLDELQNLMRFLLPTIFESSEQSFDDLAEMLEGSEADVEQLTDRMKAMLGPFVLRRLKTEVAGQLTEKRHITEFIDMTPEQNSMYETSLTTMRDQFASKAAAAAAIAEGPDSAAAVEKFLKRVGAKKVSHIFTHLRKVAQHPMLIRHHYDDATVEDIARKATDLQLFGGNATLRRITDELMAYSDYSLHAFCYNAGPQFAAYRLNSTHLMTSAKFRYLAQLLPQLKAAGSRPLIFSQWTAVLDVIEWLMDELRLPYVRLDGSTAVDERLATVDRFNTSEDVFAFLLSTRAGGQGLNLTGADTVILHDVDFNPQIDRQAEDRCHRLGQTKPVVVYRLVTKNSVDQNIYNMSQQKLKLDAAVLKGITQSTRGGNGGGGGGGPGKSKEAAAERQQMGAIMHRIFAGVEDYDTMANEDPNAADKGGNVVVAGGIGGSSAVAAAAVGGGAGDGPSGGNAGGTLVGSNEPLPLGNVPSTAAVPVSIADPADPAGGDNGGMQQQPGLAAAVPPAAPPAQAPAVNEEEDEDLLVDVQQQHQGVSAAAELIQQKQTGVALQVAVKQEATAVAANAPAEASRPAAVITDVAAP